MLAWKPSFALKLNILKKATQENILLVLPISPVKIWVKSEFTSLQVIWSDIQADEHDKQRLLLFMNMK